MFRQHGGDFFQAQVARQVAKVIVIAFKMVDIAEQQAQRRLVALAPLPFELQGFIEAAAVGDARQSIKGGEFL